MKILRIGSPRKICEIKTHMNFSCFTVFPIAKNYSLFGFPLARGWGDIFYLKVDIMFLSIALNWDFGSSEKPTYFDKFSIP